MAIAGGRIVMQPSTLALILEGSASKGDVCWAWRVSPPSRPPSAPVS